MLRFIIRFIGLIALALGFIGIVIDGTRSMANVTILFSSLAEVVNTLVPDATSALQASVNAQGIPWLWDNVLAYFIRFPASVVCFVLGAVFLKIGQKREQSGGIAGMPPLR